MKIKYTMKEVSKPVLFEVGDKVRIILGFKSEEDSEEISRVKEAEYSRIGCISERLFPGYGYYFAEGLEFTLTEEILAENDSDNTVGIIYWFPGLPGGIYDYALEKIET